MAKRFDEMTAEDASRYNDGGMTYAAWYNYHCHKAKVLGWDKPRFPQKTTND